MGFKIFSMDIKAVIKFNRDGVGLIAEVEVSFPEIVLNIEISTNASENNLNEAKKLVLNACNTDSDVVKLQIFTAENLVAKKYDNKRFIYFNYWSFIWYWLRNS